MQADSRGNRLTLVALPDQSDAVCEAVEAWLAQRAEQERLERQWQELEHELIERCRASGLHFTQASKGRSREARAMRALMDEIKAIDKQLDEGARRIIAMPVSSVVGALALIELGLAIQEPLDCEEHVWELLRRGADRLRERLHA